MIRIALVDDDMSVRNAVSRLLRTYGYSCSTYASGEAALADPQFLSMDCLVVDIQLGGINGVELCDRLQSLGFAIPHIFITAHVDDKLPAFSGRLRDFTLLIKPFQETTLIDSIERAVARST